ncbi:MAG TPA: type II toxin-antitoxin system PemK/MazF family toxin [Acetobacteraceae bacterium]|jgi:mRNA interferase MazF|nr:type II toxin-antitoxin system PemK/MazF family toxin [Acetobacteraceae bacterium]
MRRGDVVTVSAPDDYGKPRPAVVIQSNELQGTDSVLLCLITTAERDASFFRVPIAPTAGNGLLQPSNIMVDKIVTMRRDRCGSVIGRVDQPTLLVLNRTLALVLGIAD